MKTFNKTTVSIYESRGMKTTVYINKEHLLLSLWVNNKWLVIDKIVKKNSNEYNYLIDSEYPAKKYFNMCL